MPKALTIVKQFFPKVASVEDAMEPMEIEVTRKDTNSAQVKNHNSCALAVACKRSTHADGVIVSVSTAYLIHGTKAFRYHLPSSVSREIVSFDRNGGFFAGKYKLNAPHESVRLGVVKNHKGKKNSGPRTTDLKDKFRHRTSGIRTSLGQAISATT